MHLRENRFVQMQSRPRGHTIDRDQFVHEKHIEHLRATRCKRDRLVDSGRRVVQKLEFMHQGQTFYGFDI